MKGLTGKNVIRKKLFLYFLVTTILTSIVSVYTYVNSHLLAAKMNALFMNNVYLTQLYDDINSVEINLESYLSTKHSESLKEYYKYKSVLGEKGESLRNTRINTESELLLKDIGNMINTYLSETEEAVNARRGRNIYECRIHYSEASKVYGFITSYIDKLKLYQFQDNTSVYLMLQGRLNVMQTINIIIRVNSKTNMVIRVNQP